MQFSQATTNAGTLGKSAKAGRIVKFYDVDTPGAEPEPIDSNGTAFDIRYMP